MSDRANPPAQLLAPGVAQPFTAPPPGRQLDRVAEALRAIEFEATSIAADRSDLVRLGRAMRTAQRAYFAGPRDRDSLLAAKAAEVAFDNLVNRLDP